MSSVSAMKEAALQAIDAAADDLNMLSQQIWSKPELSMEEHEAHAQLTDFLEKRGFPVERHHVLETGWRAVLGGENNSGPRVAVLCEYDALPGIGHACGHNLIAEIGVGAALGIQAAFTKTKNAGQQLGQLHVVGTPGEEAGGGKVLMLEAGTFQDVDAAMMCHPTQLPPLARSDDTIICIKGVNVTYRGKASHAAAFPWEGINALDAAVLAYNNISVLRQQIKPEWRVHGVITNGGAKPNIIPEVSSMEFAVRTPTLNELKQLEAKVTSCFMAAATATSCTVDIEWNERPYLNMRSNEALVECFENNSRELGINLPTDLTEFASVRASTDMGNVSYAVPSIHPLYNIPSDSMPHNPGFTKDTGAQSAQSNTLLQAKALAMTAIDVYTDNQLLENIKRQFAERNN